jgi:serine/threonine protein kinase
MPLAAGMKLDVYEILSLLGAGGMGEVYRARDPVLRREVAIKILPSFDSGDMTRLHRFEQEARAAAALNHPNILAVYQFGVFESKPYLVSELLEGNTLRQLLRRGPLPVRKMIDYGVQIANGLAAAHEKGIVHRDLKPENLFVTRDGRVKILDFGLAKLTQQPVESDEVGATITHETDSGTVMGTAGYMAPEQVRGKSVDHRADIFAFGAILYEMLAGVRAFKKPTAAETMTAILNEEPPPISQIAFAAPPGLLRVVHRCLEKNPEQRFHSASDLAFALEALSEMGSSSGSQTEKPVARRARRRWLWAATLAVAAVLGVVGYFLADHSMRLPQLRVSEYRPITHDGYAKTLAGADGSNLYITKNLSRSIAKVLISSGEIEEIAVPDQIHSPFLLDVSPDASSFLINSDNEGVSAGHQLWNYRSQRSLRPLGYALDAAYSRDENSVAYSTPEGDIRIVQSDGSGDHKLASAGGKAYQISWKPDGSTIRFTRDYKLWEVSANGSNPHQLLPNWRPSSAQCCGNWSSDGSFYFFTAGDEKQIWALDERPRFLGKTPAEPIQLTSSPIHWSKPIPSKDGKNIFSRGFEFHGVLSRYDPKTKKTEPFLGGIPAEFMSFSKDGQFVAYVSFPEGTLFRAKRDGTRAVQLSDPPMYAEMPRWSPDGKQILFIGVSALGTADSYMVPSDGGTPQKLIPGDNSPKTDPNWSPDGQSVVFSVSETGGRDPKSEIHIIELASRKVTALPESLGAFSPRWSPDGRYIAAISDNPPSLRIFNLETRRWSILPQKTSITYPEWSRDGQYIYFLRRIKDPGIFRIRVNDAQEERILDLTKDWTLTGHWGGSMALDPTEAPLFLFSTGRDDIYELSLELK